MDPDAAVRAAIERHRDLAADYFTRRIAAGDLTGIDGPEGNEQGAADAPGSLPVVSIASLRWGAC
jgi:hypothetical protein